MTNPGQIYQEAIHYLQQHKLRLTRSRRRILKYLIASECHPTAERVYKELVQKEEEVSLATVYNTLNQLASIGLVKEIRLQDGSRHFDFFLQEHYYLICTECGQIVDWYEREQRLKDAINQIENSGDRSTDFQLEGYRIEFYGKCAHCVDSKENQS